MHLQYFPPTCYMRGVATRAHELEDLYPLQSKLKFRLPACIIWLYYASSSTMWWFLDNFFFLLSVSASFYTLRIHSMGFGSTWGHNFYMGMQNGSKQ